MIHVAQRKKNLRLSRSASHRLLTYAAETIFARNNCRAICEENKSLLTNVLLAECSKLFSMRRRYDKFCIKHLIYWIGMLSLVRHFKLSIINWTEGVNFMQNWNCRRSCVRVAMTHNTTGLWLFFAWKSDAGDWLFMHYSKKRYKMSWHGLII